jgi:hypothetical protein
MNVLRHSNFLSGSIIGEGQHHRNSVDDLEACLPALVNGFLTGDHLTGVQTGDCSSEVEKSGNHFSKVGRSQDTINVRLRTHRNASLAQMVARHGYRRMRLVRLS